LRKRGTGSLINGIGLGAFVLFKKRKMIMLFIFAILFGVALQLTNAYGDTFLHDFKKIPEFAGLLAVRYPAIIMSISQMSETLFILVIPFFILRFGIKKVMIISMTAWVLRFGLFAYGNPAGGLWMIILSCIVYGMAFDFFNIAGSIYIETQSEPGIRASAQGLFMMMSNGVGAFLGTRISGIVIDKYFKISSDPARIQFDWHSIWLTFALYALVVVILFAIFFRYKHESRPIVVSTKKNR